jgi:hypothetical protein
VGFYFQLNPMVEQDLVEAYFESNGFLVRQAPVPTQSLNQGKKKLDALPAITVLNPRARQNDHLLNTRLFSADLSKIHAARVATLGWENSSFSAASLTSDVQLMKFFKQEMDPNRIHGCFATDQACRDAGITDSLKILVVPALPKGFDRLQKLNQRFEELEVDGVLTLRSILENLLRQSQPSLTYDGHEVMQTLRLVKAYGLSKDPQLEIFNESLGEDSLK